VLAGTVAGCSAGPTSDAGTPRPTASAGATLESPSIAVPVRTAPMSRSVPVRVLIPAIGVDSRLMALGLQRDGSLEVPPSGFPAGWYTGSPTPGELGPAIVVGHVHWGDRWGVFKALRRLAPSDEVLVRRRDGSTAVFRVTSTRHFAKDAFPTRRVYGDIGFAGLRLITCGGHNVKTGRYDDNVVVFAALVASSG
jgi:sortase (surface protein transpeptidase)